MEPALHILGHMSRRPQNVKTDKVCQTRESMGAKHLTYSMPGEQAVVERGAGSYTPLQCLNVKLQPIWRHLMISVLRQKD